MGRNRGAWRGGVLALTALVCASGATALARTSGYAIHKIGVKKAVEQQPVVHPKQAFKITVQGSAKTSSPLDIYLDYRPCPASAAKETKRDSIYKAGYSYFIGPSSVASAPVKGSFTKSFIAHPGNLTGTRYVCAYIITTGKHTLTRAVKSATYKVTK